jgi:transcriptional regulator with XRE-family HTH domain
MDGSIGSRIRKRRRHQEISQKGLAQALSVSVKTISNWETDAHAPRGAVLNALAEALSTTVAYIMGESEDPGIDANTAAIAAASYDDEPPVPGGLFKLERLLRDSDDEITNAEWNRLQDIWDPRRTEAGARACYGWSPGEWLKVLEHERRLMKEEKRGSRRGG